MHCKYLIACTGLALVLSIAAHGQQTGNSLDRETLPKECQELEDAQRACTEHLAAGYERVGHPEAAKTLRDALPTELEQARKRWNSVPNKEHLALSCAMGRDNLKSQPSCTQ